MFKIDQYLVRREVKRRIKESVPQNELHNFKFLSTEVANLDWVKPKKEFRLGEHMYDVVTKTVVGDSTYFSCINDVKEKNLFAHLDELAKKQNDRGNTPLASMRKMAQVYLSIASDINFNPDFKLLWQDAPILPAYNKNYSFLAINTVDHPPRHKS